MPLGNKPFENTVGKGEIARNKQFLLFPQCFSTHLDNFLPFSSNLRLSSANYFSLEESNGLKTNGVMLTLSQPSPASMCLQYKSFESAVGKGEISPFPTVFPTHLKNFLPFSSKLKLPSANSFSLEELKICYFRKG